MPYFWKILVNMPQVPASGTKEIKESFPECMKKIFSMAAVQLFVLQSAPQSDKSTHIILKYIKIKFTLY